MSLALFTQDAFRSHFFDIFRDLRYFFYEMAIISNENEYIRHLENSLHIAEDDGLDSWDSLAFR